MMLIIMRHWIYVSRYSNILRRVCLLSFISPRAILQLLHNNPLTSPVTAIFTIEAIKHFKLIQTLVWKKFIGLGWRYRPSYENIIILSKDYKKYNFFDTSKKCSNVIEGINQDIPQYRGWVS